MVAPRDSGGPDEPATLDLLPPLPASQAEHLLKVAGSIGRDANKVWADLWAEFRRHVTRSGIVLPELQDKGFSPSCGWPEFLEQLWLLKHYLDSIERICNTRTH